VFSDKKLLYQRHGFTLIEVMLALLVFMVIMLGLAKGELTALSVQSGNLYRDEALRVAEDELTRLKSERFSILGNSTDLDPTDDWSTTVPTVINVKMRSGSVAFARSVQITNIASSTTALKRIDVAVGWTLGQSTSLMTPTNRNHQASLSTIIVQSD
jgi:prepilin-type N-terminal cleavage/methylation domain-containing protein